MKLLSHLFLQPPRSSVTLASRIANLTPVPFFLDLVSDASRLSVYTGFAKMIYGLLGSSASFRSASRCVYVCGWHSLDEQDCDLNGLHTAWRRDATLYRPRNTRIYRAYYVQASVACASCSRDQRLLLSARKLVLCIGSLGYPGFCQRFRVFTLGDQCYSLGFRRRQRRRCRISSTVTEIPTPLIPLDRFCRGKGCVLCTMHHVVAENRVDQSELLPRLFSMLFRRV